jgi:cell division protein ZapA (FtsZ GTPase activity inhibitor)
VTVLEQQLVIRSDADEACVKRVASFVEGKIQEVLEKTKTASTLQATLLAFLNIADELLKNREEGEELRLQVVEKLRSIVKKIDLEKQQVL